jgi:hypothetical protein
MENKGKITISLGTAICIFIIVLLVIALVGVICYNSNKGESKTTSNDNQKVENVLIEKESEKDYNAEAVEKISKEGTRFIIDKIYSKGDKYEVTAYILEENRKTFTQEEYNQILNGKEFNFRNKVWKYEPSKTTEGENFVQVKSGNSLLALLFDKEDKVYFLENIAGAKTGGLDDTLKESVKFELDKEFYFAGVLDSISVDNGILKIERETEGETLKKSTINDLKRWVENNCGGSYDELLAFAVNGKIVVIQTLYMS